MNATIAATSAAVTNANIIPFLDACVRYWPLILGILALFGWLVILGVRIGKYETKMENLKEVPDKLGKIDKTLIEITTFLRGQFKTVIGESMGIYGQSNSPIVLKKDFRPLVEESGLKQQVDDNESKLVEWLKSKKPKTGLDAQNYILDLVSTDKLQEYIDTNTFKQHLYKKGLTTAAYYGILGVYLFERIIPKVISEKKNVKL